MLFPVWTQEHGRSKTTDTTLQSQSKVSLFSFPAYHFLLSFLTFSFILFFCFHFLPVTLSLFLTFSFFFTSFLLLYLQFHFLILHSFPLYNFLLILLLSVSLSSFFISCLTFLSPLLLFSVSTFFLYSIDCQSIHSS